MRRVLFPASGQCTKCNSNANVSYAMHQLGNYFGKWVNFCEISNRIITKPPGPLFSTLLVLTRSHAYRILSPRAKHDTFFVILLQNRFVFSLTGMFEDPLYWNSCHNLARNVWNYEYNQHWNFCKIQVLECFFFNVLGYMRQNAHIKKYCIEINVNKY